MGEIILNRMYTGGYISSGINLAHEVINLIKDDSGRNFIYVQAYGTVAKKHCKIDKNGKVNNKVKTILLVKPSIKNVWEIVAKAEDLKPLTFVENSWKQDRKKLHDEQIEYISRNEIKYGGVLLNELFNDNLNDENAIYYTFQAERVFMANKPIYITSEKNKNCLGDDSDIFILDNVPNFAKSSLKMYVEVGKSDRLSEIIEDKNKEFWGEETKCFDAFNINTENNVNFLKIINKEDDELIFSCLFKYVFEKRRDVTKKFFEQYGVDLNEDFNPIEREEGNIDLLIYDKKNVIVIENKIKSGINGVKNGKTQLDTYYEYVTRQYLTKEDEDNEEENKYYKLKPTCFIFVPDHNYLEIPESKYSKNYKKVKYSDIYKFFKEHHYEYNNDLYFDQFFAALEKHTKTTDNTLEDDMYRMLNEHIKILKLKNK